MSRPKKEIRDHSGNQQGSADSCPSTPDPVSRGAAAYLIAHAAGGFDAFTPPETPSFSDVPVDHCYYAEIEYMAALGVMLGYWDGFRPYKPVDRAQMAEVLAPRALFEAILKRIGELAPAAAG